MTTILTNAGIPIDFLADVLSLLVSGVLPCRCVPPTSFSSLSEVESPLESSLERPPESVSNSIKWLKEHGRTSGAVSHSHCLSIQKCALSGFVYVLLS